MEGAIDRKELLDPAAGAAGVWRDPLHQHDEAPWKGWGTNRSTVWGEATAVNCRRDPISGPGPWDCSPCQALR
jgi:hypothetical protein